MIALRTGQVLAGGGGQRSLDHVTAAPLLAIPSAAELHAWALQALAQPMMDIMHPVIVWVPDGLDSVVRDVLVRGHYTQLRSRRGVGGAWQRFSRRL